MAQRKAVALGEDFGDPAAVADLPIGFITQQTARHRLRDFRGLLQRELGLGPGELLFDDPPELVPLAPPAGEAAFRRCAEWLEMDVVHAGLVDGGGELSFRETRPARDGSVTH